MEYKKLVTVLLVLIFFLLGGCSMFEDKPSEEDIRKSLAENLPGYMKVSDIKIQAIENIGSKVEPEYHSRYVTKIKLLKPTFEKIGHVGGNVDSDVVRLVLAEGTSFEAFGKAISVLERDNWNTMVTSLDFAIESRGELLEKFKKPVVEGSNEYEDALNKFKEWDRAKAERLEKLSEGFNGKWDGTYICGQGITGLTLTISASSTGMIATFDFYPTPKNTKAKSGSFSLMGQFSEDGSFSLEPKEWEKRPKGYRMVGMIGKINDNLNEITGKISRMSNCKAFHLNKQ